MKTIEQIQAQPTQEEYWGEVIAHHLRYGDITFETSTANITIFDGQIAVAAATDTSFSAITCYSLIGGRFERSSTFIGYSLSDPHLFDKLINDWYWQNQKTLLRRPIK